MTKTQGQRIRPMNLIENNKVRTVTYMKRKDCIKKKAMELATLCGIEACVVCFGPDGKVETWPENPNEVKSIINLYRESVKNGRGRGMKVEEEISGAKKDGLKKGLFGWDDDWLSGLSADELMGFMETLKGKIESVADRIEFMSNEQHNAANYGFEMMNSQIATNNMEIANSLLCQNPIQISDSFEVSMNLETANYSYINPMVSFDTAVNSATPIWSVNCFENSISDEKLEETHFSNSMNSQQVLTSSGSEVRYNPLSPLDEIFLSSSSSSSFLF